jgi:hypothetical protein
MKYCLPPRSLIGAGVYVLGVIALVSTFLFSLYGLKMFAFDLDVVASVIGLATGLKILGLTTWTVVAVGAGVGFKKAGCGDYGAKIPPVFGGSVGLTAAAKGLGLFWGVDAVLGYGLNKLDDGIGF